MQVSEEGSDRGLDEGGGRWVKACLVREIPRGRPLLVVVEGAEISVAACGGRYFAVSNICAHQHASALHLGRLEGCTLECPMHGWVYDLTTGRGTNGEGRIATYATRVEGDALAVLLP